MLASIGQLEFFYDQAPDVMRSCSMALQLLSVCIGSYLSGALVAAISSATYRLGSDWLPQDLNYGRLDLFFLLLAGEQRPGPLWQSSGNLLPLMQSHTVSGAWQLSRLGELDGMPPVRDANHEPAV